MPRAAAVIIGNEILTGKFADENGPYFIRRLRTLGCDLVRMATIADDLDAIADEVRRCSALADVVLTTGGVGPTHDDMTLEGIARAFDVPLEERADLIEIMRHMGIPIDEATLRMARVPAGTELIDHAALSYPLFRCRNVYIFPGVPTLMKMKFEAIADHFAGEAVSTARLYVDESETSIAARLEAAARRHPTVDVGSYPRFGEGPYRVIVTLESRDAEALQRASADIAGTLHVIEVS